MARASGPRNAKYSLLTFVLGKEVGTIFGRWATAEGIPHHVLVPPEQCRKLAGIYADESLWPKLVGLQKDDQDVHRKLGIGGLQDWGDGEAQQIEAAYETMQASLSACTGELRKLASQSPPAAACYTAVVMALAAGVTYHESNDLLAQAVATKNAGKLTKLKKKAAAPSTPPAALEKLHKHISFLEARALELAAFTARVRAHAGQVSSLPASATAAHTATMLLNLLHESHELLDKGVSLANVAASKVRTRVHARMAVRPLTTSTESSVRSCLAAGARHHPHQHLRGARVGSDIPGVHRRRGEDVPDQGGCASRDVRRVHKGGLHHFIRWRGQGLHLGRSLRRGGIPADSLGGEEGGRVHDISRQEDGR